LQSVPSVTRTRTRPTSRFVREARAGVVLVEQLLILLVGLCVATALYAAGVRLLVPRYTNILGALSASAP
jgi:hypothetical protein